MKHQLSGSDSVGVLIMVDCDAVPVAAPAGAEPDPAPSDEATTAALKYRSLLDNVDSGVSEVAGPSAAASPGGQPLWIRIRDCVVLLAPDSSSRVVEICYWHCPG